MENLIFTETFPWKGQNHIRDLFVTDQVPNEPISQCQAVAFDSAGSIILFRHVDNYYSLPGGTVEPNESFDETLRREVYEESACRVISYGLIGYIKDTNQTTGEIKYQLRYWATVSTLDEPVNDPDGKALERVVASADKAAELLNWGEMGEILINLATTKRSQA